MTARKYCSTDCRDQFRRERTGESHPLYKKTSHPCDVCGKEIKVTPKMLNRGKCLCSKECRIENHRRALKGRPKRTNRFGKEAARVRDGGRCVICGFDVVTAVHHLIARKNGGTNDLTNLVTLCPNHHYMAHAGLISVEVLREKATPFEFHAGMPVVTRRGSTGVNFRA